MSMSELPRDLLEEILFRVPDRSLRPLRSTCKQWNSIFNDQRFRSELSGFGIYEVFHCDGLLLYINALKSIMEVWNPFMGKTRWIQGIDLNRKNYRYVLGSYQDNKSGTTSYKVLRYSFGNKPVFEICELYSNSWRIIDVTPNLSFYGHPCNSCVSLKGKNYFFAFDEEESQLDMVSFDYTTESFGSRMSLPYQFPIGSYFIKSLSSVRDEKLSLLLQLSDTSSKEIWVTNKIDETTTQVLLWTKVLTVDYPYLRHGFTSFLFDEENRKIVCCERGRSRTGDANYGADWVYIVGDDNKVTKLSFGEHSILSCVPHLFPSLVQIEHPQRKE
ncbi:PREDICTED: putative F-box protein At4g09870 [Camelina sativa]|uniref:F-box protein At4g09870 n=1 Tax=Camelina sativa TaxID=90675 RepID=A0ABM0XRM0_CAMSA|nr:PREDICTED: putative F-box protein At4g09870 [Camelina sativa]